MTDPAQGITQTELLVQLQAQETQGVQSGQLQWWLGLAEAAGEAVAQGALATARIHLSIADETFAKLNAIPVTQPVSLVVQQAHHSITALSYETVAVTGRALGALARQLRQHVHLA